MTLDKKFTPGCLITKGPEGCPDRFLIPTDGSEYVIGSEQSSDMPIQDSYISRAHLALGTEDGSCYIKDLKSRNGTRLRSEKINSHQRHTLADGDEITLAGGQMVLIFRDHVEMAEGADRPVEPQPRDGNGDRKIYVDVGKHEVYVDGHKVLPDIQSKAFDLLCLLFESDGNLVKMNEIKARLWKERGYNQEAKLDRYGVVIEEKHWVEYDNFMTTDGEIHQLVRRLRRRLEKYSDFEYVQSVRGQGYKLVGFRK